MLSSYFFHKWGLDSERRPREHEMHRRQHLVRIEELTIQKLEAERQLHETMRLRYQAEANLLTLKAEQKRRSRRSRRRPF